MIPISLLQTDHVFTFTYGANGHYADSVTDRSLCRAYSVFCSRHPHYAENGQVNIAKIEPVQELNHA